MRQFPSFEVTKINQHGELYIVVKSLLVANEAAGLQWGVSGACLQTYMLELVRIPTVFLTHTKLTLQHFRCEKGIAVYTFKSK